jgi:tRNA modification GTPase
LAEPGEFTLRAFLAGRLDLTQAEAVLGVIDAGGAGELQAALAQLAGGLARPLHQLRENLVQLLAELEAGLDFVEDDIRFISQKDVLARLESAAALLETVTQQLASRYAARELSQVALVGPPNVGKSSLFNALVDRFGDNDGLNAKRAAPALVSAHRGTTRDYLTAMILLDGVRCELVDTAGVDGGEANLIESVAAAAQAFAAERRRRSAVRVCCIEASTWNNAAADVRGDFSLANCDVVALTKADLVESSGGRKGAASLRRTALKLGGPHDLPVVITSSRTGMGLDEFRDTVRALLTRDASPRHGHVLAATAERCGESIRLAATAVEAAAELTRRSAGDELISAELRVTLAELGKVVGAVYTDDLLDRIFKTFCIGK